MIASYNWLKDFFDKKLPEPDKLSEGITMHSFEVEGVEKKDSDVLMDMKTTPNLNHSCLCHRGIAREIGTIFSLKPKMYSREFKDFKISKTSKNISVKIDDPKLCRRYMERVIENVNIGPSPKWLKEKIEIFGQKSINNVVDATNFVMLEIGQPMHAFDADKLGSDEIVVKNSKPGEKITTLDKKEAELDESILLITDGKNPLAIAGIKGGTYAELDVNTKNIVLESANFNPALIRKTAQKIKIKTDASKRYENDLTPELCGEAMEILTKLIVEIAGTKDTKVSETIDNYPRRSNPYKLGISSKEASDIIGVEIKDKEIENIFDRFGFEWKKVKPVDEVLKLAEELVGAEHKKGASISYDAPKVFDCSSYVGYVFAQAGVQIPRISIDQYVFGQEVNEKDIKPGDIVFSNTGEGTIYFKTVEFLPGKEVKEGVDHCGIYLGGGKVIHSSKLKNGVAIENLSESGRFRKITGYRRMSDNQERFVVTAPAERLDLRIKEDLAEEIGRIYGYEKIKDIKIPKSEKPAAIDKEFYYKEKIRDILYKEGFSEAMNYTFTDKGEIELANPMSPERKFLRTNLADGIKNSLELNSRYSELIDMPEIRIFEFGHVFTKSGESKNFALGVKNPTGVKKPKEKDVLNEAVKKLSVELGLKLNKINKDENISEFVLEESIKDAPAPKSYDLEKRDDSGLRFKKISQYPFIIRDVAVFTPDGTKPEDVFIIINKDMTDLAVKTRLFDVFTKDIDGLKKTSYAYRIVFQSYEKTLSDEEVNQIMEKITKDLNANAGWQVR